jgi:hypothetical protein
VNGNGGHVTRAELAAHIARIDSSLQRIDERLEHIEVRLDARPVSRWLAGRATQIIDRSLPVVLAAAAAFTAAKVVG